MLYAATIALGLMVPAIFAQGPAYLVAPNEPFFNQGGDYSEAVLSGVLGCGEPNEVQASTNGVYRRFYQLDTGANSGNTLSMTTCNFSDFDTGLSLWEWDSASGDFWQADLVMITDNDEAPGCLGGSKITFSASNIVDGRCYFAMVGTGSEETTGDFDLKMNCGTGSNNHVIDCPTFSPTVSPTPSPTTDSPTKDPTTAPPTTPNPTPAPVATTAEPTIPTFDECCVARKSTSQSECEGEWDDETGCNALGWRKCTWVASNSICNQCCLPKKYWRNNAHECGQQSTQAGCLPLGQCIWSGLPHCN